MVLAFWAGDKILFCGAKLHASRKYAEGRKKDKTIYWLAINGDFSDFLENNISVPGKVFVPFRYLESIFIFRAKQLIFRQAHKHAIHCNMEERPL